MEGGTTRNTKDVRDSVRETLKSVVELAKSVARGEIPLSQALRMLPDPPRLAPILNRIIDENLHPLAERNRLLYLVDSMLHTAVEIGDTLVHSAVKTLRYNVSKLLEGEKRG